MKQTNGNGKKSLRYLWEDYQLPIMATLAIAALVLGFIGFARHGEANGETRTFLDNLYLGSVMFYLY